ncbi:translation initiation factor IF-2-like [Moschus berezovskii]|uniref:translation initiation factor IF-2-like n=1 Tax=Moschus berezovskii TaxID=68408 RepID=UPI00244530C2|nr:translation initiation factor IF-2-like [Moschus berezovskii]
MAAPRRTASFRSPAPRPGGRPARPAPPRSDPEGLSQAAGGFERRGLRKSGGGGGGGAAEVRGACCRAFPRDAARSPRREFPVLILAPSLPCGASARAARAPRCVDSSRRPGPPEAKPGVDSSW